MACAHHGAYLVTGQPKNGLAYVNNEFKRVQDKEDNTELGPNVYPDLVCDTYPTLHENPQKRPILYYDYIKMPMYVNENYKRIGPGTFETEGMFTKSYRSADYIYWGYKLTYITQSLSGFPVSETDASRDREVVSYLHKSKFSNGYKWNFTDPQEKMDEEIKKTTILNDPDVEEYIVFAANSVGLYQHFLMDHLGYIAFLRKTIGSKTKIILPDGSSMVASNFLKTLDPDFVQRKVVFLQCNASHICNHRVIVDHPTATLKVLTPVSTARNIVILQAARDWIREVRPLKPNIPKKIIYYTRHKLKDGIVTAENSYKRAMDIDLELDIIRTIRRQMERFNRTEELVIFDGSLSFDEQLDLFRSATMIIGAHGGGLANILFSSLDSKSCAERTKVLEFKTNHLCPDLQWGSRTQTFYNFYTKAAWIDYHHIHFIPPSDGKTAYIDLEELNGALYRLMSQGTKDSFLRTTD